MLTEPAHFHETSQPSKQVIKFYITRNCELRTEYVYEANKCELRTEFVYEANKLFY